MNPRLLNEVNEIQKMMRLLNEQETFPYKKGDVITFEVYSSSAKDINEGDEIKFKIVGEDSNIIYGSFCDREDRLSCTASQDDWDKFYQKGRGFHGNDLFLDFDTNNYPKSEDYEWCAEDRLYIDSFCGIVKK